MDTEYGIASRSLPDIENLGPVSRRTAEWVLRDSLTSWPDVYLVERHGGDWEAASDQPTV
ncbi:hypothetical protein ACWEG1_05900 [Streptomyces bauhiniae]